MTTEVEALADLHLWLAEKLPELRTGLAAHKARLKDSGQLPFMTAAEFTRGWVPNVTTDGLLEALSGRWPVTLAWYPESAVEEAHWQAIVFTVSAEGMAHDGPSGNGHTAHEALCRAAKKALG